MSDYMEEIKINKHRLEEEIINQPGVYIKWAEKAARAMVNRIDVDKKKKLIRAELDRKYRAKFAQAGEKVTENGIDACIRMDDEYKAINEKFLEAMEEEAVMVDVKWAFQQRKTSLELLQEGIINGIYADPTINTKKALADIMNKKRK
jgi:hypothetical protein